MGAGRVVDTAGEPTAVDVCPPSVSLALPGDVALSANALTIAQPLDYESWERCGAVLSRMHGATQWWIGDWLNFGEHAYGERYAQAVDEKQAALWAHFSWVARSVSPCLRKQLLSYHHHEVIAKLEPADQAQWLDKAIAEQWTVREFRAALRGVNPPDAWTLSEALKIAGDKLSWLRDRWPEDEWDALVNLLRGFADGLAVDA